MKIKEVIEVLHTKDPEQEVEYIVCKPDGELVAMLVQKQAKALIKLLKFFGE